MTNVRHAQLGAPTNTPQHLPSDQGHPPNPTPGQGAGNAAAPAPHNGPQGLDRQTRIPQRKIIPTTRDIPAALTRPQRTSAPILRFTTAAPARPHNAGSGSE